MATQNAIKLAKSLDFDRVNDLYMYILTSLINGNRDQCRELFLSLNYNERKECFAYLNEMASEEHFGMFKDELIDVVIETVKKYKKVN